MQWICFSWEGVCFGWSVFARPSRGRLSRKGRERKGKASAAKIGIANPQLARHEYFKAWMDSMDWSLEWAG